MKPEKPSNDTLNVQRVGKLLKCFRENSDMSLRDTARTIGLKSRNYICMVEHADSNPPMARIFDHCNAVQSDELMPLIILKYAHKTAWDALLNTLSLIDKHGIGRSTLDETIEKKFADLLALNEIS
jgi:hypothetical protein